MKPFVIEPQFELHRNPDDEGFVRLVWSHTHGQMYVDMPEQGTLTDREYRKRVVQPAILAIKSSKTWREVHGEKVH